MNRFDKIREELKVLEAEQELLRNNKSEGTINPSDITINYRKCYGAGCYELAGEESEGCMELDMFVMELLGDDYDFITQNELDKLYRENYKDVRGKAYITIPEKHVYNIANDLICGSLGNAHYIHFEDIELNVDLNRQDLMESIRLIKMDLEGYYDLEDRDYDRMLEM